MTSKGPRRGKLAQFVADHVFGDKHLQVMFAIMNHERAADEFGHDRACPGPRLDRLFRAARSLLFHLLEKLRVDVGPLF